MGLFSGKNEVRAQVMLDCLSAYVRQYAASHPAAEGRIAWVVSETEERISAMSGAELRKLMRTAGASAEHCALDVLMDRVLYWIQRPSADEGARDDSGPLFEMWNDLNDCLFRKGYISRKEHDKKREMGELLSQIRAPF